MAELPENYQKLIDSLLARKEREKGKAEANVAGEMTRRGLTNPTGTSDIEFSARKQAVQPIEESYTDAISQMLFDIEKEKEARAYQTSERIAGQEYSTQEAEALRKWQTGERLSAQDYTALENVKQREWGTSERLGGEKWGTSERMGQQDWGTQERLGGQDFTSGENKTNREWESKESALDRQATLDASNTAAKQAKRDWWKGFFHA